MNSSSDSVSLLSATNIASVLMCLMATILVFALKLHKKAVYRLALYQVLAALAFAIAQTSQTMMVHYKDNPLVYGQVCVAMGWLVLYLIWMKLLFTMWVTFHLFCFAVLHKNLQKLEVLYVVTSLLVPAVIACVPLITKSYGYSAVDGCFIPAYLNSSYNLSLHVAVIERFYLVEGPALGILFVSSTAMVFMAIKVAQKVCWRWKYEEITDGDQFWRALKQLLPLAAFPILFFVFFVAYTIFDVYYSFLTPTPNDILVFVAYLSISLWSLSSGVTLIVHIAVVRLPTCCRKLRATRMYGRSKTVPAMQ